MAGSMDNNRKIASLLRDLAAVQTVDPEQVGLQARSLGMLNLDDPIESYLQPDGTLRKIPNIGPSSTRVILEVLQTGTIARLWSRRLPGAAACPRWRGRGLRENFLSRAQVAAALRNPKLRGPKPQDYRGDLQMHSTWSDGAETLEDTRRRLHRARLRVLRHDRSLLRPADRRRRVDGASSRGSTARSTRSTSGFAARFRMIKGIEANIRADGARRHDA